MVVADCVFCQPERQPDPLFETDNLRVVPDKYPVIPGHTLVISREHLPCFGAASDPALFGELDQATARASDFIRDEYQVDPLTWENGVVGQTVFHAHLHLIPTDRVRPLAAIWTHWEAVEGWAEVQERYRATGEYHYVVIAGQRYLLEGDGPAAWQARAAIAKVAGLKRVAGRWIRVTSARDVEEVSRRFARWATSHQG